MSSALLKLYETLESSLGKEQAKVITEAIAELTKEKKLELKNELREELTKELVTKYDLQLTEQTLKSLIEQIRSEMQAQTEQVKGELKTEIEQVKNELLKWLIVLFIGQATFIVGLVFTLVKLLKG